MKAYKLEVLVIDHEGYGVQEFENQLENLDFVHVVRSKEAEIGEWDDDHPLNQKRTMVKEFDRLFSPPEETPCNLPWPMNKD